MNYATRSRPSALPGCLLCRGAPGEGERRGREMKETTSQFHTKKFEGKWEDFKYVAVEPALAAPGRRCEPKYLYVRPDVSFGLHM